MTIPAGFQASGPFNPAQRRLSGFHSCKLVRLRHLLFSGGTSTKLGLSTLSVPGLQVEGPSGPLQVQLGDSVLLPCSLEVEWRRSDSETLVLLFQDGEERGEEPKFRNRAHFFTEEISRGNFSLFLTDVTPADAGTYRCSVHTEKESGDTTALISVVKFPQLFPASPENGHFLMFSC
uniref:Ig-like domain-containing protein n=1 Tax=Denticeps clupeoides TaxID=299321 RepID=A0AAY4DH90_9TELE